MLFSTLKYALWLAAPLMQITIVVMMRKRGFHRDFPFFQTYSIFHVVSNAVLFGVYRWLPDSYFYAYWVYSVLGILLGFLVIHEVFGYAIRPYVGLRDLGMVLFRWAAILLVLVSSLMAASGAGSSWDRVIHEIANLERSVRLVQCGLLLFIVMFSSYLGLPWKNFACGVSFGFGLFAVADMVLFSLRAQFGPLYNNAFILTSSGIYNLSVLLWLGYSVLPQTASARGKLAYQPLVDRWNQAAMTIFAHPGAAIAETAYLSDIEKAVERVLEQNAPSH